MAARLEEPIRKPLVLGYRTWIKENKEVAAAFALLGLALVLALAVIVWNTITIESLRSQVMERSASQPGSAVSQQSVLPLPGLATGKGSTASDSSAAPAAPANVGDYDPHPIESGHFPGTVVGPAIAETDEGGLCSLRKIPAGESLTCQGNGSWWRFRSDEALNARYEQHKQEYIGSHRPECQVD